MSKREYLSYARKGIVSALNPVQCTYAIASRLEQKDRPESLLEHLTEAATLKAANVIDITKIGILATGTYYLINNLLQQ